MQPIVERWDAWAEIVKAFAARPAEIALEFDDFELLFAPGDARGAYAPSDNVSELTARVKPRACDALPENPFRI